MKREFLRNFGLEDDVVDKIMAEHGKAFESSKGVAEELEALNKEKTTLESTISALSAERDDLSTKFTDLESERDEYKQTADSLKTKDLKLTVALKHNLPIDLADRLVGEDEESLQADAQRLAGFIQTKPAMPLRDTEPEVQDEKQLAYKNLLDSMDLND